MSLVTSHYFLGGKQIAYKKGSTLEYVHTDHLGSTSVTTSASGTEVSTVKYFPFGGTRSTTGTVETDKLFTGQRLDQTGLYFYNARYYDATIGRFISPDTIVSNPMNPQSLNRYSYCLNNPLRYTDPSGHQVEYMTEEAAHDYVVSYQATGGLDLWEALELHAVLTGTLPEGYYSTQGHTMSAEVRSAWLGAWDYQAHLEHNPRDTAGAIDKAIEVSEATYIKLGGGDLDIIEDTVGAIWEGLQALDRELWGIAQDIGSEIKSEAISLTKKETWSISNICNTAADIIEVVGQGMPFWEPVLVIGAASLAGITLGPVAALAIVAAPTILPPLLRAVGNSQ